MQRHESTGQFRATPLPLKRLPICSRWKRFTLDGCHSLIDLLVNNSGVMAIPERRTPDGFAKQFGVNHHLAPWGRRRLGRAGSREFDAS